MNTVLSAEAFHKFLSSILPITNEATLILEPCGIRCNAFNIANCAYVNTCMQAPIEGESDTIPIDILKLNTVIPSSGEIELYRDDNVLVVRQGKSTFKFDIFAPNVVRPSRDLSLDGAIHINDIPAKELSEAIESVASYHDKKDSNIIKIVIDTTDGQLHIRDIEDKIDIVIDSATVEGPLKLYISYMYLSSIVAYLKKWIDGSISFMANNNNGPLIIKDFYKSTTYLIATLIDPDEDD